jgi:hypothetical protein
MSARLAWGTTGDLTQVGPRPIEEESMRRVWLLIAAAIAASAVLAACGGSGAAPTGSPSASTSSSSTSSPPVTSPSPSTSGPGSGAIDPNNFVVGVTNPWFPLTPGTTFIYEGVKDGKPSVVTYRITSKTKVILGVTTTVISDILRLNGKVEERTLDWYAQDKQGNVWYFGEATATFDAKGNVISREGSWQAGVDGAQPGIFMPAHPIVGKTYRQEYYKGHAEDHFKILSFAGSFTVPYGHFTRLLKTGEWTPLEPAIYGNKYYRKGLGLVAEQDTRGSSEYTYLVRVIKAK